MDQRKLQHSRVTIPLSELGGQLADAGRIKSEMARLLKDLEASAARVRPSSPGVWRHDPVGWQKRHKA